MAQPGSVRACGSSAPRPLRGAGEPRPEAPQGVARTLNTRAMRTLYTLNPGPQTPNSKPYTLNPRPQTLNPKP